MFPPLLHVTDFEYQFESSLWSHLMSLLGTKCSRTTAYHPQTNEMVEQFHRRLKSALKTQPTPDTWMDTLPLFLLSIQTSLKTYLSSTAAEMVYGSSLRSATWGNSSSPLTITLCQLLKKSTFDPSRLFHHDLQLAIFLTFLLKFISL